MWLLALLAVALVVVVTGCVDGTPGGGSGGLSSPEPGSAGLPGSASPSAPEATPTATPTATPMPTPTPTLGPAVWKLAWSDEFDGPAGSPPDPSLWGRDLGDGTAIGNAGWGNQELEFYTDGTSNVATDGEGHLVITARVADGSQSCWYGPCEYTSARLLTKGLREVLYGRIEARIKVPVGAGLWPAFWMLGADIDEVQWPASGEIDIMEYVGRWPNWVLGTIHGPGYYGSSGPSKTVDLGEPVADDFHTFAIEWRPGHIAWFLDGSKYFEVSPADVAPRDWVFERPFFLLLNVAVGGSLGGPVAPETTFPQSMVIDYVRVYEDTAR